MDFRRERPGETGVGERPVVIVVESTRVDYPLVTLNWPDKGLWQGQPNCWLGVES